MSERCNECGGRLPPDGTCPCVRDADDTVTWRGRRIDDMTRDELIAALKMAGSLNRAAHKARAYTLTTWASLAKARMARHG